ncbi:MAG: hypothetical protein ACR2MO_01420 [Acidimicrobiales bacterium]
MRLLDVLPLAAARRLLHLTLNDLWASYFALGGSCSLVQVENHLAGAAQVSGLQHDVLVHALNEEFQDRDMDNPLEYSRP